MVDDDADGDDADAVVVDADVVVCGGVEGVGVADDDDVVVGRVVIRLADADYDAGDCDYD